MAWRSCSVLLRLSAEELSRSSVRSGRSVTSSEASEPLQAEQSEGSPGLETLQGRCHGVSVLMLAANVKSVKFVCLFVSVFIHSRTEAIFQLHHVVITFQVCLILTYEIKEINKQFVFLGLLDQIRLD